MFTGSNPISRLFRPVARRARVLTRLSQRCWRSKGAMHELSIASGILESVLEFVSQHSVAKVLAVKLALGQASHVEAEQLQFCYQAIIEGTPIEGSILEIETVGTIV